MRVNNYSVRRNASEMACFLQKNRPTRTECTSGDVFHVSRCRSAYEIWSGCMQQARLHMHTWAMDNITSQSTISVHLANLLIDIRFNCIDKLLHGNCPRHYRFMSCLSLFPTCAARHLRWGLKICKQCVKQHRAKECQGKTGDDGDSGAAEEPLARRRRWTRDARLEPPIIMTHPTFIDCECAERRIMFVQSTLPDMPDISSLFLTRVRVYVGACVCTLGGRMRCWNTCFFSSTYFSF